MRSFLKKDLLVFWRDRKEVLISLLAPIVLIIVLNFAFAGLAGENADGLGIQLGIVMEDDESLGREQFKDTVLDMNVEEIEKEAMIEQASTISPSSLITSFLSEPELNEVFMTKRLSEQEAREEMENGDLDAVIKVPEGFTYSVLSNLTLNQSAEVALVLQVEEQSSESDIIYNIMSTYLDTLNFQFALQDVADGETQEVIFPEGGMEVVADGVESMTIAQYFTISMSSLFALFIAATVAMKTATEKRERVFNRIILTNANPISFLIGKMISTFCFAWFQLMCVFIVCQLLLDVFEGKSMEFWVGVIVIITFFSLAVAGLSAVFTTLTLNINNTDAVNGASNLAIMFLAAVGGNFLPITEMPEWLQRIGEWTPNGLSISVFLQWVQFGDPHTLIIPMMKLLVFFIACLIIGIVLFPKRRRA